MWFVWNVIIISAVFKNSITQSQTVKIVHNQNFVSLNCKMQIPCKSSVRRFSWLNKLYYVVYALRYISSTDKILVQIQYKSRWLICSVCKYIKLSGFCTILYYSYINVSKCKYSTSITFAYNLHMEGAAYKLYAQQGDILHTLQCCLCDHFCSNTNKWVISHFLRVIFKRVFLSFTKMELIWYLHRTLQLIVCSAHIDAKT